jgi:hypothetical protein
MKFRALLLLALASLTASCASKPPPPVWKNMEPRPIGQTPGDTIETIPGWVDERRSTVISIVRAFPSNGKLAVCGALVLAAPKDQIALLASYVTDQGSELVLDPEGEKPLKLSPRFMHRYTREVPDGLLEASDVDYGTIKGDCIQTDIAWLPDYESANRLDLRKTVYKTSSPTYISVPGPARHK